MITRGRTEGPLGEVRDREFLCGLDVGGRDDLLRAFQEDRDGPPIPLLSLRAAGFGLNLTRATHVIARDLARHHAVALTTGVGLVEAVVDASPVRITFPTWSGGDRGLAWALARGCPGDSAGDLPDTLAGELGERGIDIAAPWDAHCRCRARQRPCVHVLATVYALVLRLDERPVLALELRSDPDDSPPGDPDWIPLGELDAERFFGG